MKCKGDLKEYSIVGRKIPSAADANPKLYRCQIFAPNTVAAKSRFWYFISYYKKINKTAGEIVELKEVREKHPGSIKNYVSKNNITLCIFLKMLLFFRVFGFDTILDPLLKTCTVSTVTPL